MREPEATINQKHNELVLADKLIFMNRYFTLFYILTLIGQVRIGSKTSQFLAKFWLRINKKEPCYTIKLHVMKKLANFSDE